MHRQTFLTPRTWTALRVGIGFVACAVFAGAFLLFAEQREKARAATQSKVEAESMTLSGSKVVVRPNSTASGGQEVAFYTNGSASSSFDGAATNLTLRARGNDCQGDPQLKVYVDGALKGTVGLTSGTFANYTLALSGLSGGAHTLRVSFENNFSEPGVCDRNAYLDYYVLTFPDEPPSSSRVLVGAGDIAKCSGTGDEATAKLLDGISGTVFTVGDNAYTSGTAAEFSNCYDPSWGRHKARTKPTPGNHEYLTAGASGYFGYFGSAAGPSGKGYYSYNLGGWHVVALNSMCREVGGCGATSPMVSWLKQDLAANADRACTIAYFHHPLFSSGSKHGSVPKMKASWDALYAAKAEVVVSGHEHNYERFAPQSPSGQAEPDRGIREFVVGTGGGEQYPFGTVQPNSQVRNANTFGVLKLTLHPSSYEWKFVPVAGKTFTDSGTKSCH
jgi:hypothetical protein